MLKIQPKQINYRGDAIATKVDSVATPTTHTDCTLAMDGRMVTVLGAVADIDVGAYCMYPVVGDTRIATWEYVSTETFNKYLVTMGG